jgi:hypothetical protein
MAHCYRGHDAVTLSSKALQHLKRMLFVLRFTEDEIGNCHHCVCAQYDRIGMAERPDRCLVLGQCKRVGNGILPRGGRSFHHVRRIDFERHTEARQ